MQEIKESQEKKHISYGWTVRINIVENVHNTKNIYRVNEIPIKILEIWKVVPRHLHVTRRHYTAWLRNVPQSCSH